MRVEKHVESLKEVMDEIDVAMKDSRGLNIHQRRIASMLSIGVCDLIEIYLHKLGIIKSGSRIKHDWFRKKRIKEILEQQIICPVDSIKNIDKVISLAVEIESVRDNLMYSVNVDDEELILDKINKFFELKKAIESEVGEIYEAEQP